MRFNFFNPKMAVRIMISLLLLLLPSYHALAQKVTDQATIKHMDSNMKCHHWQPLFKQKQDTANWESAGNKPFPNDGWSIKDNELILLSGRKGGDIITKKEYKDFELKSEFKMTELVNSGIKYFVNNMNNMENGKPELIGFEYQIIDDFNQDQIAGFNDAKGSTGALYLLRAPKSNKHLNPPGEWNSLKIKVRKGNVKHWLNGQKILKINIKRPEFQELVQQTKFKNYADYGNQNGGYILIQDHGSQIHYRNIIIKERFD